MDKEKANYIGVIWSNEFPLEWFEKELSKAFSQPIYQGCFACALGRKSAKTGERVVEATPAEVLTVALWTFAGIAFVKDTPEALTILKSWMEDIKPEQVIALVASHQEVIDSIRKISENCGYWFKSWSIGGRKEMGKTTLAHTDEADLSRKALRKIDNRINSLKENLSVAQEKRDAAATESTVRQMRRLEAKRRDLTGKEVILIRT